jgi:hypothetical protein
MRNAASASISPDPHYRADVGTLFSTRNREGRIVCCAIAVLGVLGPRALILFWWLTDPTHWNVVFDGPLAPILGFLFLPWTTIMYVLVWSTGGLSLLGWLLVGLGLVVDLGTYGGGGFGNRDRMQSSYRR